MNQNHSAKYVHDLGATSIEVARENARIRKEKEARATKFRTFDNLTGSEDFLQWLAMRGLELRDRLPDLPRADEAEMSALGAMMMEPEAATQVLSILHMASFGFRRHQLIWKSARLMYQRQMQRSGEVIDLATLASQLRRDHVFDEIGGGSYLTACLESCPSSANVAAYIRVVQEVARLRFTFVLAEKVREAVLSPDAQPGQLINAMRRAIDAIDTRGYADLKAIFEECK